jgi:hypothetical protein
MSINRRAIVLGSAASVGIGVSPVKPSAPDDDAELLRLAAKWTALAQRIDQLVPTLEHSEANHDEFFQTVEQLTERDTVILEMRAKTIPGLQAKAKIALWHQNGKQKTLAEETLEERMLWSLVLDLV